MIKILFITSQLETGGTESHIFKLCTNLNPTIFQPFVLCTGPVNLKANFTKKLNANKIPILSIHLKIRKIYRLFGIIKYINKNEITIIHSFLYKDVKWDVLIFLLSKAKVLITERRNLQHWRTSKKLSIWEIIRNKLTHTVIANSTEVLRITTEIEKIPIPKIRVIHNGFYNERTQDINTIQLIKKQINYKSDDFLICNIANLKEVKRQEDIIEAIRHLKSRGIENVKLLLVGRNDQNYRQKLDILVDKYRLHKEIFFLGELEEPQEVYCLSDIMVLSSEAEGFSNSVIESLFYGTPVIATHVGGNIDIIENNLNGYLYSSRNIIELSDRLLDFYKLDKFSKNKFSKNAINSAKLFSINKMTTKYSEFYCSISKNNNTSENSNN